MKKGGSKKKMAGKRLGSQEQQRLDQNLLNDPSSEHFNSKIKGNEDTVDKKHAKN